MSNKRMTAEDTAELIFDAWFEVGDDGMSQTDTLATLNLTAKQFKRGKEWLRDNLCVSQTEPFTYDPRDNVYRLNTNSERVEEYYAYRLAVVLKQLQRLADGTGTPARDKWKGNRKFIRYQRHLNGFVEDIQDLLAEIDA